MLDHEECERTAREPDENPVSEKPVKRWLTLEEVRERIETITKTPFTLDQVYGLTRRRQRNKRLKSFRFGKSKRVSEQAFEEFIQQQEGRP